MTLEARELWPQRIAVGHCDDCGHVIAITNRHGGSWPLAKCRCGWADGIQSFTVYESPIHQKELER